jgi:hypothetical protein
VSVSLQYLRRDESATETRDAQYVVQCDFVCLTVVTISDHQGDITSSRCFDDHAICDFDFEAAVSDCSWDEITFEQSHVCASSHQCRGVSADGVSQRGRDWANLLAGEAS